MIVVTAADGRLLPGTAAGQLTAGGAAAGQPAARQLALNSARRWTELRAWAGNDSVASFGKSRCCGKWLPGIESIQSTSARPLSAAASLDSAVV